MVSQLERHNTKTDIKAFSTNHNKKVVSQSHKISTKSVQEMNFKKKGSEKNKSYTKTTSIFRRNAGIKDN